MIFTNGVFFASDPCLSDCLATFEAKATLAVAPRSALLGALPNILHKLEVTHVLCTPTLWSLMAGYRPQDIPSLRVVALGGEPIPRQLQQSWARKQNATQAKSSDYSECRLFATYGVTEGTLLFSRYQ
jgi:acyl-coenzyme A synthetase/AMP-(fatty) acid ligase